MKKKGMVTYAWNCSTQEVEKVGQKSKVILEYRTTYNFSSRGSRASSGTRHIRQTYDTPAYKQIKYPST